MPPHPPTAPSWSALATPSPPLGVGGRDGDVRVEAAGVYWDAVGMPLRRGLAVLDRAGLEWEAGYPVLADCTAHHMYVLVPAGTGMRCVVMPGVRVLTEGSVLLLPRDRFTRGTERAMWLCPQTPGLLVPPVRLAEALAGVRSEGRGPHALAVAPSSVRPRVISPCGPFPGPYERGGRSRRRRRTGTEVTRRRDTDSAPDAAGADAVPQLLAGSGPGE
jgi:hypothetical protein